jgi:hypothetical protein
VLQRVGLSESWELFDLRGNLLAASLKTETSTFAQMIVGAARRFALSAGLLPLQTAA